MPQAKSETLFVLTYLPPKAQAFLLSVMTSDSLAKLILRLTLGGLMLPHGIAKLQNGTDGIAGMLGKAGLPEALAQLVIVGEMLAPMLLILGVFTRPAALIVAINMVFAVGLVHMHHFFELGKSGGWSLELQAFFFFVALAVAFMGSGKFRVGPEKSAWWA